MDYIGFAEYISVFNINNSYCNSSNNYRTNSNDSKGEHTKSGKNKENEKKEK